MGLLSPVVVVTDGCNRLTLQASMTDRRTGFRCGMVGETIHMYLTDMHLVIRIDRAIDPRIEII